jgi:hypothetical protein
VHRLHRKASTLHLLDCGYATASTKNSLLIVVE